MSPPALHRHIPDSQLPHGAKAAPQGHVGKQSRKGSYPLQRKGDIFIGGKTWVSLSEQKLFSFSSLLQILVFLDESGGELSIRLWQHTSRVSPESTLLSCSGDPRHCLHSHSLDEGLRFLRNIWYRET